jgi:hypothetical protein
MAPLPPVPKCMRIQFIYSDGGDFNIINNTYWTYTGSVSATDMGTMVIDMGGYWNTHMSPLFGNWVTLETVAGNDLNSSNGVQAFVDPAFGGNNVGTGKLSSGACFVLSFEGQTKYRGGHSRIYLPAMPAGNLADPNSWTLTQAGNVVSAWTALRNAFVAAIPVAVGTVVQVIAHRFGASATAPVGVTSGSRVRSVPLDNPHTEPVQAFRGNTSVGSQRRRNQYSA